MNPIPLSQFIPCGPGLSVHLNCYKIYTSLTYLFYPTSLWTISPSRRWPINHTVLGLNTFHLGVSLLDTSRASCSFCFCVSQSPASGVRERQFLSHFSPSSLYAALKTFHAWSRTWFWRARTSCDTAASSLLFAGSGLKASDRRSSISWFVVMYQTVW